MGVPPIGLPTVLGHQYCRNYAQKQVIKNHRNLLTLVKMFLGFQSTLFSNCVSFTIVNSYSNSCRTKGAARQEKEITPGQHEVVM